MAASEQPSPSSLWWAYFVLWLALTVLSQVFGPSSPLDLVSSIVNAFALVGLWGYIRQVAVGWRPFWVGYFILSVVLSLVALVLNVSYSGREVAFLVFVGFSVAFVLPLYVALWRYAFRSSAVWSHANA